MEAAIKAAGVKALRLLFVFAASVPERVAAAVLTTESAALPVVKSIGLFELFFPISLTPKKAGRINPEIGKTCKKKRCGRRLIDIANSRKIIWQQL